MAITEGLSLVYRRTGKDFGIWSVRIKDAMGGDRMVRIGPADDFQNADSETILTFPQAQEKARALSKETKAIGPETCKLPTVAEAAAHYLAWCKEHRKSYRETEATVNAHILPTLGNRLVCPSQDRAGDRLPRTAPHLRQHPGPDEGGPAHHIQMARPRRYPHHQPALCPPVRQHPESRCRQAAQLRASGRNQGAGDTMKTTQYL